MKLVFFGSPSAAAHSLKKLLEKGHHIELVITQPDRPAGRGKKTALSPVKQFSLEHKIPVYQPEKIRKDPIVLKKIKDIEPGLNVVVAYGQIIPKSVIYSPKFNSINVHFSLLPKYRGASPVQWAVLNGEKKTGVTIFELNENMDEGDILARQETQIFPREYAYELEARLAEIGAELLCRTLDKIERIPHQKQDHSKATYAPKIKKEQGRIDWSQDAVRIDRKVRAFTPWPSAFSYLNGKRIKILKGRDQPGKVHARVPGEILCVDKEGIEVLCGQSSVYLIEELQPEGKKPMSAHAFSLGEKINGGKMFESKDLFF
jgi:methionyl-tRNA formyltransferase